MRQKLGYVAICVALAGCAEGPFQAGSAQAPQSPETGEARPQARPDTLNVSVRPPPPDARTAEQFDTTTNQERAVAAAAPVAASEKRLGATVASLGDPARPGFWIETPLVTSPAKGRVVFAGSGKSAQVDLIPIAGPATAGSRMSLAAMRLIELPLTALTQVEVFSGG